MPIYQYATETDMDECIKVLLKTGKFIGAAVCIKSSSNMMEMRFLQGNNEKFMKGIEDYKNHVLNKNLIYLVMSEEDDYRIKIEKYENKDIAIRRWKTLDSKGYYVFYMFMINNKKGRISLDFIKMGKNCTIPVSQYSNDDLRITHPGMRIFEIMRIDPRLYKSGTIFISYGKYNDQEKELLYLYDKEKKAMAVGDLSAGKPKLQIEDIDGICPKIINDWFIRNQEWSKKHEEFFKKSNIKWLMDMGPKVFELLVYGRDISSNDIEKYILEKHNFLNKYKKLSKDRIELYDEL